MLKKKMKYWIKVMASAVMAFSMIFASVKTPLHAADVSADCIHDVYGVVRTATGGFEGGKIYWIFLCEGVPAYCIQPGIRNADGGYEKISLDMYNSLSAEKKQLLSLYSYFGYGYGNHTATDWYCATQSIIWDELGFDNHFWNTSAEAFGHTTQYGNRDDYFEGLKSEIRDLANKYRYPVKWNTSGTSSASGSGTIGESITFSDDNGALGNLTMVSSDWKNVTISGNTVTVIPDHIGKGTIRFADTSAVAYAERPLVLFCDGAQTMFRTGSTGVSLADLEITAYGKTVTVLKMDADGNPVSGAELVLYDSAMNELERWITDGTMHTTPVLSPGTYYLKEDKTPAGYVKAKDLTMVVSADSNEQVFTMTDTRVEVSKGDSVTVNSITGAHLQIIDEGAKVIDEWISDGTPHFASFLEEGNSYVLHEEKAPFGYEISEDIPFTLDSKEDLRLEMKDRPKTVSVKIVKCDRYDNTLLLQGAQFGLYTKDGAQVTDIYGNPCCGFTDENGIVRFDFFYDQSVGSYYVSELNAPDGYCNDHEGQMFEVNPDETYVFEANNPISFSISDTALTSIRLQKTDAESGAVSQGEATLEGAEYVLIDDRTQLECGRFVTNENGESNVIEGLPFDRTYTLIETKAPEGYLLNTDPITVKLNEVTPVENVRDISVAVEDMVFEGSLSIYKHCNSRPGSEFDLVPEEGAVFGAVSESLYKTYGSVSEALKHTEGFGKKEYSVAVTDANGIVTLGPLAYGTYIVGQIGQKDDAFSMVTDTYTFCVDQWFDTTEEPQDTVHISATNDERLYSLRIVKLDSDSGKHVTLKPAVFRIRNTKTGEYVSQKVGAKVYDRFATSSRESGADPNVFYANDSEGGELTVPLQLKDGTYELEEVKTPDGYRISQDPIPFEIHSSQITECEEDGTEIIEIEVENTPIYGTLELVKTLKECDADTSLIDRKDLSSVRFKLIASGDITDPADGSVLYAAGEVFGEYNCSKEGYLKIDKIPLGEYVLVESATEDGVVLSKEKYPVLILQNEGNRNTGFEIVNLEISNRTTLTEFSKKGITGEQELEGAHLRICDEEGNILDEWVSGNTTHRIEGLTAGGTYSLVETIAPDGYVQSEEIKFRVRTDGSIQKVVMKDGIVTLDKTDGNGNEVKGAVISIRNEIGETVDTWTSDGTPHRVSGLTAGESYLWHEEFSDNLISYYYACDNRFTVSKSGELQALEMIDEPIRYRIEKRDDDGNFVSGVLLSLMDITDSDNPKKVELPNNGVTTDSAMILDSCLLAEHTYLLHEESPVPGVYPAQDIEFRVSRYGSGTVQVITMTDERTGILFEKTDTSGNPVSGAKIDLCEVIEDTDGRLIPGKVIQEFVTGMQRIDLSSYVEGGKRYALKEKETPIGYRTAEPYIFTVSGKKDAVQILRMVDEPEQIGIAVHKSDSLDPSISLKGAVFVLKAQDGTILTDRYERKCEKTTDENGVVIFEMLYSDEFAKNTCYVEEIKAPTGYLCSKEKYTVEILKEGQLILNPSVEVSDSRIPVDTGVSLNFYSNLLQCLAMGSMFFVLYVIRKMIR